MFLGVFIFILVLFCIFWGVFNKTIIPLALVGYEMIIANEPRSTISYPARARGIIVEYNKIQQALFLLKMHL